MPPVRLHSDPAALPAGAPHVALLDPFWGPGEDEDPKSPISGRFRRWRRSGADVYELAPLAEADCVVVPAAWEHYEGRPEAEAAARELAARAATAGKPVAAFYVSDSTAAVPLERAHVFRTSLYRSARRPRDHAMPALSVDVADVDLGGEPPLREWREPPVVGFCGLAPGAAGGVRGRLRSARRIARRLPEHPSAVRTRACRRLAASPRVATNFLFRDAFWAGAVGRSGIVDYDRLASARREFVENLVASDYVLAVRGGGNFSYRLNEAMSAARIPLFVETDSVLPLEDAIDWRSLVVWVDEAGLDAIGDRVADFHARLGPDGFAARQRECRRVWLERLSPEGFYRSLAPRLSQLPA